MNIDRATPELWAAIAAAQVSVGNATKNAKNPHFGSQYADLGEVLSTVRPVFSAAGVAIVQSVEAMPGCVTVTTALCHSAGGMVSSSLSCKPSKDDAQGIGGTATYLRRYGLAAMCGIAQEDDDGNSASGTAPRHDTPRPTDSAARPVVQQTRTQLLSSVLGWLRDQGCTAEDLRTFAEAKSGKPSSHVDNWSDAKLRTVLAALAGQFGKELLEHAGERARAELDRDPRPDPTEPAEDDEMPA